jgi:hypothetical protein
MEATVKSRIAKIALCLALAVPASYATVHIVREVSVGDVLDTVAFYTDLPTASAML